MRDLRDDAIVCSTAGTQNGRSVVMARILLGVVDQLLSGHYDNPLGVAVLVALPSGPPVAAPTPEDPGRMAVVPQVEYRHVGLPDAAWAVLGQQFAHSCAQTAADPSRVVSPDPARRN